MCILSITIKLNINTTKITAQRYILVQYRIKYQVCYDIADESANHLIQKSV